MTLFERFPYWVFVLFGILLLAFASLQYMSATGALHRMNDTALRPAGDPVDMIFFGEFDANRHIAADGEVHILGQIDPFNAHMYAHEELGNLAFHMFFPAVARPGTEELPAVVVVEDNDAFLKWMGANVAGNASIGDLYAINGRVTRDRRYVSHVVNWISEMGMTTPEEFIVIRPFMEGAAAPVVVGRTGLMLPVAIMLTGLFCLFIGHRRWELHRAHTAKPEGLGTAILEGIPTN